MWSSSPSPPVGKLPKRLEKNTRDGWGGRRRRRIHHDSRTRKGKGVGWVGTAPRRSKFANCGFCLLLLFAKKMRGEKNPRFASFLSLRNEGDLRCCFFPLCLFPNHSFSHVRNCQFGLPPLRPTTTSPPLSINPRLIYFPVMVVSSLSSGGGDGEKGGKSSVSPPPPPHGVLITPRHERM